MTAIAAPTNTVPPMITPRVGPTRRAAPSASTSRHASTTVSLLRRRVSHGATGASTPQSSSGTVESRPITPAVAPRSCCIWASSGPKPAIDGRKLSATSTMAVTRRAVGKGRPAGGAGSAASGRRGSGTADSAQRGVTGIGGAGRPPQPTGARPGPQGPAAASFGGGADR